MDGKRTPELSDEALDLVAGGLSINDGFSGINTISTSGPSVAGPGAGTGDSGLTIGGDNPHAQFVESLAAVHEDSRIGARLKAAGTFELYYRDVIEYKRQHDEWEEKYAPDGLLDPLKAALAGPEPVPPDPYDYL